jgi:hypothetical protein
MTYAEREKIFSKEVLTIEDFMLLYELGYQKASELLKDMRRSIKLKNGLRVDIQGRLHTQDYLDYLNIPSFERYVKGEI